MAKRRRKKNAALPRQWEQATMERRRQMGGLITEIVDRDLRGNPFSKREHALIECALDAYRHRQDLSESEYEAGLKFRRAYQRAVLRMSVEDQASTGAYDPEMAMLIIPISEEILRAAYASLTPAQKKIVVSVCGHDEYAGTTDRVETLHRGLERLAALWKL